MFSVRCLALYVHIMVNNDYDKFSSFSRLYMTVSASNLHIIICTEEPTDLLALVPNGQVAALSDWAY